MVRVRVGVRVGDRVALEELLRVRGRGWGWGEGEGEGEVEG